MLHEESFQCKVVKVSKFKGIPLPKKLLRSVINMVLKAKFMKKVITVCVCVHVCVTA